MSRTGDAPAIKILTLFPDMIRTVLETSILGRAQKQGQVRYEVVVRIPGVRAISVG